MNRIYNVLIAFVGFFLLGCTAFQSDNGKDGAGNSYQSLNEIIPLKYEIEDKIDGNFNLDEFTDELVLIRMVNTNDRRLLILFGKEDGRFSLHLNSDKIVRNTDMLSQIDPYLEVKHVKGEFSIRQLDLKKNGCEVVHTFKYSKENQDFNLISVEYTNCKKGSGNSVRTTKEFETVNLLDFDINKTY